MQIAVGSAHRNNAGCVRSYVGQCAALRDYMARHNHHIRIIAVEGDSTDETRDELMSCSRRNSVDLELVTHTTGAPHYGSVEDVARMVALSGVGNAIFGSVKKGDDILVYVESDLIWTAETMSKLINQAHYNYLGFDVFAPLIMAGQHFYDVWGFRDLQGNRFGPFPPYSNCMSAVRVTEVSSVGSCLVMRNAPAMECRIRDGNALVGWCADARSRGYRIGVDPLSTIRHPA